MIREAVVRNAFGKCAVVLIVLFTTALLHVRAGDKKSEPLIHPIKVPSEAALIHLGSLDSFDRTEGGTKAAKLILEHLESGAPEPLREAIRIYQQIIPAENFGGEYTALQWLCEYLLGDAQKRKEMTADKFVAAFQEVWAQNEYSPLKSYLHSKYRIPNPPSRTFVGWTIDFLSMVKPIIQMRLTSSLPDDSQVLRFREDFILFNNPRREQWEKSSLMIEKLGLKKGDTVADIGSGAGYFTFKFADQVGKTGKVYGIDVSDQHIDYLNALVKKHSIKNVEVVKSSMDGLGLQKDVKVDCAFMCSLYHILYTRFTVQEHKSFLDEIKKALKPDGTFVVVDNAFIEDTRKLPYHGRFIAKELVIAQLEHMGWVHVDTHQFIPQRYMLVFKLASEKLKPKQQPIPADKTGHVLVESADPLVVYLPLGAPLPYTENGRKVARDFFAALNGDKSKAASALAQYKKLSTAEEIGNEYTAFIWYCEYLLASPQQRKEMLKEKVVAEYFERLGGDQFTILRKYLVDAYRLTTSDEDIKDPKKTKMPENDWDTVIDWHELIIFNNPLRETWERSSKVMEYLKVKPGMRIADIGCGYGFYTFKLADMVGETGKVYAVETSEMIIKSLTKSIADQGIKNIDLVHSAYNDCKLPPNSVDVMFFSSLYCSIYVSNIEFVRVEFFRSIKKALKKGGKLIIVDNEAIVKNAPPYYRPRVDPRLVIEQLRHFGFRHVESAQFMPQKYVLVFQMD